MKSLEAARTAGHQLVLLVGDMSYYGKMGFSPVPPGRLVFAGPVDPDRLLYCELVEGAFDGVKGKVRRAPRQGSGALNDQHSAVILLARSPSPFENPSRR